jgi:hypothetical protein
LRNRPISHKKSCEKQSAVVSRQFILKTLINTADCRPPTNLSDYRREYSVTMKSRRVYAPRLRN